MEILNQEIELDLIVEAVTEIEHVEAAPAGNCCCCTSFVLDL